MSRRSRSRRTSDALYAFTLEFPVRPSPPAPTRATYVSLVGLPVLVVSGDPEQRLQVTNLLRGWRLIPLEADNAAMAMALLERLREESSPIPLVILANRLPVQDGFLLAFRIKNDGKFRSTLVMMLASEGKPGDAIACRENGISAYMRYPINDRQLNEAIVAVTGASVDSDETPTLVTRHSLREQRKGATILLVDPSRDSQILAAHILGRHDCSVVVAQDLQEALAALDQDVYDVILVDTSLPGLGGDDAATLLRSRIARDPDMLPRRSAPRIPRSSAREDGDQLQWRAAQAVPQEPAGLLGTLKADEGPASLLAALARGRLLLVEDDSMIGAAAWGCARRLRRTGVRRAPPAALRMASTSCCSTWACRAAVGSKARYAAASAAGQSLPVMVITARDAVADRVAGLDAGADDYVVKPFDLDELAARVRALLRRRSGRAQAQVRIGNLEIDPATRTVRWKGRDVALSARELALLRALAEQPGTYSRDRNWRSASTAGARRSAATRSRSTSTPCARSSIPP